MAKKKAKKAPGQFTIKQYHSAISGKFVSKKTAKKSPATTVGEATKIKAVQMGLNPAELYVIKTFAEKILQVIKNHKSNGTK